MRAAWRHGHAAARRRGALIAIGAIVLAGTSSHAARLGASGRSPVAPRDSADLLDQAHELQTHFEWERRQTLPFSPSTGGPCSVRVGRFCHYNDDDDRRSRRPPESTHIRVLRDSLITLLDAAVAAHPNNRWAVAEHIRYLLDAQRYTEAVLAARSCTALGWWCEAFQGLAYHYSLNFQHADEHFAAMLRGMPDSVRCRWSDIAELLERGERGAYERLSCADRARIEQRFWWLSDPLLSVPGNERRSEHFARRTMGWIQLQGPLIYDDGGDDLQELWLRFGVARFYTRDATDRPPPNQFLITGHEPSPAYRFTPVVPSLDSLFALSSVQWSLRDEGAPERAALGHEAVVVPFAPTFSAFRRGDSTLVVAAYDVRDPRFPSDSTHAALAVTPDEVTPSAVAREITRRPYGALAVTAPGSEELASVELFALTDTTIAWGRGVVHAPRAPSSAVTISDLLLFDAIGDTVPERLADILPFARTSEHLNSNVKVGIYFELYGLASAGASVPISLSIMGKDESGWHHLAERLHLVKRLSPLTMRWSESPRPGSGGLVHARALAVDLSLIPPGHYRLEVEVDPPGKPAVHASREIDIVR